ncbi:hypothetical protein TB2_015734 [Malus domestica]
MAKLGEVIYRLIASDRLSPERLLDYMDLSSEYTTMEIANRIEAAVHIWKHKHAKPRLTHVNSAKSSWGAKFKGFVNYVEKSKFLTYRAGTLLQNLKIRFPGLPQTALDMNKIQYNKGHFLFVILSGKVIALSGISRQDSPVRQDTHALVTTASNGFILSYGSSFYKWL